MISQKEGVFNTVKTYLEENDKTIEDGVKVELNGDERKAIIALLVTATETGVLTRKSNKAGTSLTEYWNGTLSNWLRKDKRLNGGEKHVIENPGSRAGVGDKQLGELKKLLVRVKGTEHEESVQKAVDERIKVMGEEKMAKIKIDPQHLPEELRGLVSVTEQDTEESDSE